MFLVATSEIVLVYNNTCFNKYQQDRWHSSAVYNDAVNSSWESYKLKVILITM